MAKNIGIVILNYNSFADTIELVKNLHKQSVANELFIVVVDNASPNNSYEQLKPLEEHYSDIAVLQTGENLGYAKGNNFGLKYLDENIHPHFVAILNNDVQIPDDCFEKLLFKYELLERPAIIAPKMLDIFGNEMVLYRMNTFLDDCLNLFYVFKLFHKRNALKYVDNTGLRAMRVEIVPGSFMFTSFEKFKTMGYFYPNTFLFAEERFITVKAKQLGFNNYILLDETYIHAHSKTINSSYNPLGKYRLLYAGWLEFTKTQRSFGRTKAVILKILMNLSFFEIYLMNRLKLFWARLSFHQKS